MSGYVYLMISILVSSILKHTPLKGCRDMPYLTENKYPLSSKVTLCQSLGRHHAHLLVQEPDKYMIGATIDMAHKTVL